MSVEKITSTLICQATFDANLPANSVKSVNMTIDPLVGAKTTLTVPKSESWVIEDIYVSATQDVDCVVKIIKNDTDEVLRTDPINTLLVSNPSRPRYPKKVFGPFDTLSMQAINLSAIGASAVTVTFYVKLVRFKAK